jgi:large subunit ribosomal protein L23
MHTFVIKRPLVTEKTLKLIESENTYVFEVSKRAEKNQIKKMIKDLFGVEAESVNTVMGHRGLRKTGRKRLMVTQERTKKALVKVKKGQKIELFELEPAEESKDKQKKK